MLAQLLRHRTRSGTVQSPTRPFRSKLPCMLRAPFGQPQKTPYLEPSVEELARDRAVATDGRGHLLRGAVDGERAGEGRAGGCPVKLTNCWVPVEGKRC